MLDSPEVLFVEDRRFKGKAFDFLLSPWHIIYDPSNVIISTHVHLILLYAGGLFRLFRSPLLTDASEI